MRGQPLEMPAFGVTAAILRRTTERLGREVVEPANEPPNWNELEWVIARASAAMQGISTLLANRVKWSGPPLWQSFLAEQKEQSELCFVKAGELIERVDGSLREAGVGAVALKGSAIRRLDLYAPGERPMGDVDLLVRPGDLAQAEAALRRLDYELAYTSRRHATYVPRSMAEPPGFGEHVDNPLRIEVHTAVAEGLPFTAVDITRHVSPREWRPGLNAYPDLEALLMHVALHAAGSMRSHTMRQIQLLDVAALSREVGGDGWRRLLSGGTENAWWVYPVLQMSERYCAGSVPPAALRVAREICPRALRAAVAKDELTDVSWSNLRIAAFPGIAWSRTPLEAVRFMHSRILPSRTARAEIDLACDHYELLNGVPWYRLSHRNRILRWIVSRPPRVQTIMSVRRALQSAADIG